MEICLSAEEKMFDKAGELQEICDKKRGNKAIYGAGNQHLGVLCEGLGRRPDCSTGLIIESEPEKLGCGLYGEAIGRIYTVNYEVDHEQILKNATSDELDLYMYLAPPELLKDVLIRREIFRRREELHIKAMSQASRAGISQSRIEGSYKAKMNAYTSIFTACEMAVESNTLKGAYFLDPCFTQSESENQ